MIRITEVPSAKYITLEVSGKLVAADYEKLVPELDRMILARRPLNVLMELHDFHGWDLQGALAELRFDIKHRKDFARIAVVGDKLTDELATKLVSPLFTGETKYFSGPAKEQAVAWLS